MRTKKKNKNKEGSGTANVSSGKQEEPRQCHSRGTKKEHKKKKGKRKRGQWHGGMPTWETASPVILMRLVGRGLITCVKKVVAKVTPCCATHRETMLRKVERRGLTFPVNML